MANETDKLLHNDYDGIQEYDNDLPQWWMGLFILSIVFAVVYTIYFEFGPGLTPEAILADELAAVEKAKQANLAESGSKEPTDEELLTLAKTSTAVAQGHEIYTAKCAACHGPEGQGLVGPNLCDKFWIHGDKITDSLKIVENGVLDKGMLAWKTMLKPDEIKAVVAFIYTLRGSNPLNPKPPQGEPAA